MVPVSFLRRSLTETPISAQSWDLLRRADSRTVLILLMQRNPIEKIMSSDFLTHKYYGCKINGIKGTVSTDASVRQHGFYKWMGN